jgi:hypothetical protein
MANATANYGFAYERSMFGPEPVQIRCAVAAAYGTAIFVGDPVKMAGSAFEGFATVIVAAAGDAVIYGIVTGVESDGPDGLSTLHSLASTANFVTVMPTGPGVVFRVNATAGASQNDVGLLFDHIASAGNTATGRSGYALDVDEAGATTGRQWRVESMATRPDNTFSATLATDTADVDLLVTCHESTYTGGAGV